MTACAATTKKGRPCQAPTGNGSQFCFWHDPKHAEARARARAKGGHARHGRNLGQTGNVPHVNVQTMQDVVARLEAAFNDCLKLENSLSRARTIATLALAMIKALQFATLEERLEAVELALKLREAKNEH